MSITRLLCAAALLPALLSCHLLRAEPQLIDGCQAARLVQEGVQWKALLQTAEQAQEALHFLADVSVDELRDDVGKAERAKVLVTRARDAWRRMESFGFDDPVTVPTVPWIGGGVAYKTCTLGTFDDLQVEVLIEYQGERGRVANVSIHSIRSSRGKLMFAGTQPQEPFASLLQGDVMDIERLVLLIMRG